MSIRRKTIHSVGCATLAIIALFGCAACGSSSSTSSGSSGIKLTVATPPVDTCSELFTAEGMGYFKKHGLDVHLEVLPSGKAISAGVLGGSVDVGCSSIGALGGAVAKGLPLRVIAPGATYSSSAPTSQLAVAAKSNITTAAQLEGKTIAIQALGDASDLGTRAWLDKMGGDSNKTKFIELPEAQMGAALAGHRIDAALLIEPALTAAKKAGTVKIIANPFDVVSKNFMLTAIFAKSSLATKNSKAVKALDAALADARRYTTANPDKTAGYLAKYTNLPVATALSITRATWPATFEVNSMQPALDNALQYKALSKPLKASAMVAVGAS